MADDMRLKGVAVNDVVEAVPNSNCTTGINNETNCNNLPNSGDNATNDYRRQWYVEDNIIRDISPNNNIAVDKDDVENNRRVLSCASPVSSQDDDSYGDSEGQSSSSVDASPRGDEYHCFSQEEVTDSDFSDDGNQYANTHRGIVNPNYPGFQEFANELHDPWRVETGASINNNNNDNIEISDSVNHLDSVENFQKAFYDKPKFDIVNCGESDAKQDNSEVEKVENGKVSSTLRQPPTGEGDDSGLCSGASADDEFECSENGNNWFVQEDIVSTAIYPVSGIYETAILTDDESEASPAPEEPRDMASIVLENHIERAISTGDVKENLGDLTNKLGEERENKVVKETENEKRMDEKIKKEEKTQMNANTKKQSKTEGYATYRGAKDKPRPNTGNRQSHPLTKDKRSNLDLDYFEVYNIETAMPEIDIEAIESHLRAAKEEERRRKADREEIRKRLADGDEYDDKRWMRNSEGEGGRTDGERTDGGRTDGGRTDGERSEGERTDGEGAYEEGAYGGAAYGGAAYGNGTYGERTYGNGTYGERTYGNGTYGGRTYGNGTYVERTYGGRTYTVRTYGGRTSGDKTSGEKTSGEKTHGDKTQRRPSLHTRLQSGMKLQICFVNEAVSDNESPNSDSEAGNSASSNAQEDENNTESPENLPVNIPAGAGIPPNHVRPSTSRMSLPLRREGQLPAAILNSTDFFSCQALLQAEARVALTQAKEMARMQMEVERQALQTSPITQLVQKSLEKVGVPFPQDRRRLSRQVLTEMNIAQLQVIVNDLHTQIEKLNESLVKFLIGRDDLHMEQDSMLVDIEDITKYMGDQENAEENASGGAIQRSNNTGQTPKQNGADTKPKE